MLGIYVNVDSASGIPVLMTKLTKTEAIKFVYSGVADLIGGVSGLTLMSTRIASVPPSLRES